MNVIWIVADTFRRDHIGAYGNPTIRTPSLDALAARSIRFVKGVGKTYHWAVVVQGKCPLKRSAKCHLSNPGSYQMSMPMG